MKDNRDIDGLLKGLTYQKVGDQFSHFVRESAAIALGEIGDVQTVIPLIPALDDESWIVCEAAIVALGKIGDKRAVEPLIPFLQVKSAKMRLKTIESLGKIGCAQAVEPLISALKDAMPDEHSIIANILADIGLPAVEPLIAAGSREESSKPKRR